MDRSDHQQDLSCLNNTLISEWIVQFTVQIQNQRWKQESSPVAVSKKKKKKPSWEALHSKYFYSEVNKAL